MTVLVNVFPGASVNDRKDYLFADTVMSRQVEAGRFSFGVSAPYYTHIGFCQFSARVISTPAALRVVCQILLYRLSRALYAFNAMRSVPRVTSQCTFRFCMLSVVKTCAFVRSAAVLSFAITHIILNGTQNKMRRIYAAGVVTSMHDDPEGLFSLIYKIRNTMRREGSRFSISSKTERTVTIRHFCACPQPAAGSLGYFGKKTRYGIGRYIFNESIRSHNTLVYLTAGYV